jgi:hypothetical protein
VGGHGTLLGERDDTKHAIFASAIVLTVVFGISLCVASFLCAIGGGSTDSTGKNNDTAKETEGQPLVDDTENSAAFMGVKLNAQRSLFQTVL